MWKHTSLNYIWIKNDLLQIKTAAKKQLTFVIWKRIQVSKINLSKWLSVTIQLEYEEAWNDEDSTKSDGRSENGTRSGWLQEIEGPKRISWHVNSSAVTPFAIYARMRSYPCTACRPSHALSLPWFTSTLSLEVGRDAAFQACLAPEIRSCSCILCPRKTRRDRGEKFIQGGWKLKKDGICPRGTPESLLLPTLRRSQWLCRRCGCANVCKKTFTLSSSLCTLPHFSASRTSLLLGTGSRERVSSVDIDCLLACPLSSRLYFKNSSASTE